MSATLALFYLLGAACLLGGLGVVAARKVIHSALFLLLSLVSVAGLYLLLSADFLALVQILIYGGAVTIVLLFALMLTRIRGYPALLDNPQKPLALVAALAVFLILMATVVFTPWSPQALERVEFGTLGQSLFSQWAVPFEVVSLVLLVALIGAIVIARPGGEQ
ncbi:MAG: NADH-quinone oxidoreductase subunit J [Dehalococcoidia bacterium]